MDETLGVLKNDVFHVRPKAEFMIKMLRNMEVDIILWSLGEDDYVRRVTNGYLSIIATYAYKIFARNEAKISKRLYGYPKAGEHIRNMYQSDIFLIGVDDQVSTNMDASYDIRIYIKPYKEPDKTDRSILHICEKLVESIDKVV